jgi:hypothetical protein
MKRGKHLRKLEELWDLEDKHPLMDGSTAGLLRWMFATGSLAGSSVNRQTASSRKNDPPRRTTQDRSS